MNLRCRRCARSVEAKCDDHKHAIEKASEDRDKLEVSTNSMLLIFAAKMKYRFIASTLALCSVLCGTVASAEGTLPNPTHHWTFNNGGATDSAGGIQDVALVGSASVSDVQVLEGSMSLQLPCCDSKLELSDASLREPFTYYTVSLWFRADTLGGYRYLYEEGGSKTGFAIRLKDSTLEAAVLSGGGGFSEVKFATAPAPVLPETWHHAVATYSNGVLSITLDGDSTASTNTTLGEIGQHNNEAAIGSGGLVYSKSSLYFEGFVDDIRIFDNVALTSDQISELYTEHAPAIPVDNRPNFLLIVADDMNFDSPGFMGGVAPDVSPNLDQLASESRVFSRAYSANSVCQPSRQAMLSGKYPPSYGSIGFWPMAEGTPTAVSRLHDDGYFTANYHKMWHMEPSSSFPWDLTERNSPVMAEEPKRKIGRSPTFMGRVTEDTIVTAKAASKPFFIVINSADTHKPFAGTFAEQKKAETENIDPPSRTYDPSEVTIPVPLPDLPDVRAEIAMYASTMRRLDDTVGHVLEALETTGVANNTVVMFVTDNGMPLPFGKFETYRDSLRGPVVVRWPGRFEPAMDDVSLVSLTDIGPTIVEIAGSEPLPDVDGRSFVPLIDEEPGLQWRDVIVGTRYEDILQGVDTEEEREAALAQGWVDSPENRPGFMYRVMHKRGITDGTYHYIYNHFYNRTEFGLLNVYPYNGGPSYRAMRDEALIDPEMAERFEFYLYRAPEEFYNTVLDPGSMDNLIDDPDATVQEQLAILKQKLLDWMVETNDPVIQNYHEFLLATE